MIPTEAQITRGAKNMKTDLKHPVRRYTQARCVLTPVLTDIEEQIEARRSWIADMLVDPDITADEANELACERVGLNFALAVIRGELSWP